MCPISLSLQWSFGGFKVPVLVPCPVPLTLPALEVPIAVLVADALVVVLVLDDWVAAPGIVRTISPVVSSMMIAGARGALVLKSNALSSVPADASAEWLPILPRFQDPDAGRR